MNLKTHKLRDAVVLALTISVVGTGSAFAQETQAAKETQSLDRITVTGSRIRQVDKETTQPVTLISREDIEKQGFQTVADILQNITATGTPPITRAAPLSSGEAVGGTYISLRNLGAARTLVLVDGRRMGITTGGLADVSTIPAAAVERIEVLKDGASSVYGSDAMAGVINIITRTGYKGTAASIYYGQFSGLGGAVRKADVVTGFGTDKARFTVAAEWNREDGIMAGEFGPTSSPRSNLHPTDGWATTGQYGGFVYNGRRVVLKEGGNPRLIADYIPQDVNTGGCTAAGCAPGSTVHKSNTNLQMSLRTPMETKAVYGNGLFEITDHMQLRVDALYNHRKSSRSIAGYPLQGSSFNAPMSKDSYFNPTGADITTWWRRTWEVPRYTKSDLITKRLSAVLQGDFSIGERVFDWDVGALWNRNTLEQNAYGNVNVINLRQAVGPSYMDANGVVRCGTAAAPIANCVPFNPFLSYGVTGQGSLSNNGPLNDYFFQNELTRGETTTQVFNANLSGSIWTLPAGDLAFATGIEHRKESGKFIPDALAQAGATTNLAAGPTGGSYSVNEAYAELQVPILADKPFAQELTLDVASRYSKYDTFGNATSNKIGLRWKPFDQLMLRATASDGFRAPTISNLYGGGSQTFDTFLDPCDTVYGDARNNPTTAANCARALGALAPTYRQLGQGNVPITTSGAQTPLAFVSGSNPLLQPEVSKSQTIGFVWSPSFLPNFNIAVDWWKIRIQDTIVGDSPTTILNDCYINGIASRCSPTLFTRDANLGIINYMKYGSRNAGFRKVEGWDLDTNYRWTSETLGTFRIGLTATYTSKDYLVSTNDPRIPVSSVGWGATYRVRANSNLGWERGIWSVNLMSRYYSGMKESCAYVIPGSMTPNNECDVITWAPNGNINKDGTPASSVSRRRLLGSNTFHDLRVGVKLPWEAQLSFGANNVFGHQGPVMYGTGTNSNFTYMGEFDLARFWFVKYQQKF